MSSSSSASPSRYGFLHYQSLNMQPTDDDRVKPGSTQLEMCTMDLKRLSTIQLPSVHENLVRKFILALPARADKSLSLDVLTVFHKVLYVTKWKDEKLGSCLRASYVSLFKNGQLSLKFHQKALHHCADNFKKQKIDAALPWIANHPEMSVDEQRELWCLLRKEGLSYIPSLYLFSTIPYATPVIKMLATQFILERSTLGDSEARRLAIQGFSASPLSSELPLQIKILNQAILDDMEKDDIRSSAASKICQWLNAIDRPAQLLPNVLLVINAAAKLIATGPLSVQKMIQAPLFSRLWTDYTLNRADLIELYKKLLLDKDFPLERKEYLASCIPLMGNQNIDAYGQPCILFRGINSRSSVNPPIELHYFINQQLANPSNSQDLKKVLVKHLVFSTVEGSLFSDRHLREGLDIISGDPVLVKASQDASEVNLISRERKWAYHGYSKTVENPKKTEVLKEKLQTPAATLPQVPQGQWINGAYVDPSGDVAIPWLNSRLNDLADDEDEKYSAPTDSQPLKAQSSNGASTSSFGKLVH